MAKRLTEKQMESLGYLARRAEKHWREFLPDLYQGFLEEGELVEALHKAADEHKDMMYRLTVEQKLSWSQAEEIANPMFLFLDPREWNKLVEDPEPPYDDSDLLALYDPVEMLAYMRAERGEEPRPRFPSSPGKRIQSGRPQKAKESPKPRIWRWLCRMKVIEKFRYWIDLHKIDLFTVALVGAFVAYLIFSVYFNAPNDP